MNDSRQALVYLDTNIISYLARGEVMNFIPLLARENSVAILSDICLEELRVGDAEAEIDFISKNNFLYVLASEPAFIGDKFNVYRSLPEPNTKTHSEPLDVFLRNLFRSVSGSKSVQEPTSLLQGAIEDILQSLNDELPSDADPRLLKLSQEASSKIRNSLNELQPTSIPLVAKDELSKLQIGPLFLGNLSPPGIVDQVVKKYGQGEVAFLTGECRPFEKNDDIKRRVEQMCAFLSMLGFSRDKRIGNDNELKSESGAVSQFNDFTHISTASICNAFLTADRRCARLAFAAYEALGINTDVVFVTAKGQGNPFQLVGADFWP